MLKKYQQGQQSVNRLQRFAGASSVHDRCLDNLSPEKNKSSKFWALWSLRNIKSSLQRKEQVSKAIFSPSPSIFSLEIIEPPADGSRRKTFSFVHVLSTRDHCHTLVKFLGKKEKHLGYRLPRALVENSRKRWARGLFEGDRDDIWRKNHLLSLNCKKLCRNLNFATEWTNN